MFWVSSDTLVKLFTPFLLILSGMIQAEPVPITVISVGVPPVIDGVLEDLWKQSAAIDGFTQSEPYEGRQISEPTRCFMLQDSLGLYIAFDCDTRDRRPDCPAGNWDSGGGDEVSVYLDCFHDGLNAYRFSVNCANVQSDEMISANGLKDNFEWDGVFLASVGADSMGYCAELFIPWSTLRFPGHNQAWGINLSRSIPVNGERAYYAPVSRNEGFKVSGFARLDNIRPRKSTKGMELFPQSFYRSENSFGIHSDTIQFACDFNWSITPSTRLQTTYNPDFSQVEADPFSLNLSKYAQYFSETRPFFVEGQEYFHASGGAMAGLSELFYSRNIGRKLPDGSEEPISTGTRITGRTGKLDFAALVVNTRRHSYQGYWGAETLPSADYIVNRWSLQPWPGSTIAGQFGGVFTNDYDNYVVSVDGTTSKNTYQCSYQFARSFYDRTSDWAFSFYGFWNPRKFFIITRGDYIGANFDVSEIGFVPWFGYQGYSLTSGPVLYPKSGAIAYTALKCGLDLSREYLETSFSTNASISWEAAFRNNWGGAISFEYGREFEMDRSYNPQSYSIYIHSDASRRIYSSLSAGSDFGYNYLRDYFARSDSYSWYLSARSSSSLWPFIGGDIWVERDPQKGIAEITYRLRPGFTCTLVKNTSLRVYHESVIYRSTSLANVQTGVSFSYNFLPKSWVYIAYNDSQARESNRSFLRVQQVFACKVKYLIYW